VYVIQRPITVYRLVGGYGRGGPNVEPIVTYGEPLLAAGVPPVHLLWSGAHYDALLPEKTRKGVAGGGVAPAA
jgi:hypothetical protein